MTRHEGELTVDGELATLRFERRLAHAIEAVWSAITDPAQRNQWMGATTIDARAGGFVETTPNGPPYPPERTTVRGRILVWDPPHVFEHEWQQQILGTRGGVVRYELSRDGDGTLLRFTHRGLSVPGAKGFHPGTHAFLDRLAAQLAGQPLPDWQQRYREIADIITN
jgi:uncharacterized protein YndB with AHSA1/START domain